MVYIYAKKVGARTYYYLRTSVRKGARVLSKDIAYLGDDITAVREKLDALHEYKGEIRKAHHTIERFLQSTYYLEKARAAKLKSDEYILRETLIEVEAARLHFTERFTNLPEQTKQESYEHFVVEFAFNTTSLEGNTITLDEAGRLLLENRTPADHTPREIFDLQNTKEAFFWLQSKRPRLDESLLLALHERLMRNIDVRTGYRTHDVRVFKARFEATPAQHVPTDVKMLIQWYADAQLHPLVLATAFHHKLEKIHPFADGNGRTGRLLMNYILLLHQYPPLIIRKRDRTAYLNALYEADDAKLDEVPLDAYTPLVRHVAHALVESYWNNFLV